MGLDLFFRVSVFKNYATSHAFADLFAAYVLECSIDAFRQVTLAICEHDEA